MRAFLIWYEISLSKHLTMMCTFVYLIYIYIYIYTWHVTCININGSNLSCLLLEKASRISCTPKCWDVQGPKNDRAASSPPSRQKINIVRLGQLPYPKQSLRISFGLAHAHHLAAAWHVTNALHGHRHWCHKCRPSGTDKFAKVTLAEGVFKMENVSVGWADVSMKLTTWEWSSHFFTKALYRDTTSTTIYGGL